MANEAYYVFMLICIPLCSVEEVFLLNLLRESSKEFFHQFICHFDGVVQNPIREVLQEVLGFYRALLVKLQVLCFHLLLTLVVLSLQLGVSILDDRSEGIIVGHAECHHLAETPVGTVVLASAISHMGVKLREGFYSLVEWEEDAEIAHAECDVGDVTYGMRQILSYLDDVGLRGAEDRYRAIRLFSILMQIWIMIGMVIMETEGGAEVGERDLMRSLGKDREGILGDIILDGW